MKATWLWSLWQGILLSFALGFSRQGEKRFVEWGTGLAVNIEEHTITQSLIGLGREGDWKALESFAEYGSWQLPFVQFRHHVKACEGKNLAIFDGAFAVANVV